MSATTGHAYDPSIDADGKLVYTRLHANGDRTEVVAERVAEDDDDGRNWHVVAVDYAEQGEELARTEIGYASHKQYAEQTAERWMKQHPKGVEPPEPGLAQKLVGAFSMNGGGG